MKYGYEQFPLGHDTSYTCNPSIWNAEAGEFKTMMNKVNKNKTVSAELEKQLRKSPFPARQAMLQLSNSEEHTHLGEV